MQRHRQLVGQERPIFPDLPTDDGVARRNVLMSIPTIPPDLSIDLTASIVSCQSCVVYTTFVGNSVLSFTTSKLNCFQIVSFAENTSVPLAPRASISQPILLLFFCFLALEFVYKKVSQIFFIPSQNLVAFKRRRNWLKKGYFRTFPNI